MERRLLGTVPKESCKVGLGMDAPPGGLPPCVACDLAPKLEADTDCGFADWGPSVDIQGQHGMVSRRKSPPTSLSCKTITD